ncbi:DUF2690 domain-containing protein [Streptomyces sp. NPDC005805]|uniref:helix-turn-helix domain-containing protein n=1 Tax=Streptomyces sp. NPDC005805 TaxID=3157068 RepID=UPI0033F14CD4
MTEKPPARELPTQERLAHERLVRELSALRRRTGLSLSGLAQRTTASRSSWHRYLSGAQLPPHAVVEELCGLAGEPPGRLIALRELAEDAGDTPRPAPAGEVRGAPRPEAPAPAPPGPAVPGRIPDDRLSGEPSAAAPPARTGRRRARLKGRRPVATAMAGALAVGTLVTAALVLRPAEPAPKQLRPGCKGTDCTGLASQPLACAFNGVGTRTVAERRPGKGEGAAMEIRYSPACEASWARMWFARIGDRLEISGPGQPTQSVTVEDRFDAEGYLSTPMLGGGPDGLSACVIPADGSERVCVRP